MGVAATFGRTFLAAIVLSAFPAAADDIADSEDHPLVGRYQGAEIVYYKSSDFDEAALLRAPHDYNALLERNATRDRSGEDWLKLEGRVTEIRYQGPQGRSSLEVMRNFEQALAGEGFSTLFSCANSDCLTGTLRDNYLLGEQLDPTNGISTAYFDEARYLLEELDRPEGAVYVAILIGESQSELTTFVKIVETRPMEADKIVVPTAEEMGAAIESAGHVDIYGILFDFDDDTLRPESEPMLDEIAELLGARPDMKLDIVGHTDNQGTAEYNLDLSRRRAASVVEALVDNYDIDADRLTASGAGLTQPVASNDTEEGRAKNRRVELVAK
jgi:OmpA-OmpF porin, OOP family